jgi:hypothetical protein
MRRTVTWAIAALVVIVLVVVVDLLRLRSPDRIHVFGRDYERGASHVTLDQADDRADGPLTVVQCLPVIGRCHRVAGPPRGRDVPTVILLRHAGRYAEYALEGGP